LYFSEIQLKTRQLLTSRSLIQPPPDEKATANSVQPVPPDGDIQSFKPAVAAPPMVDGSAAAPPVVNDDAAPPVSEKAAADSVHALLPSGDKQSTKPQAAAVPPVVNGDAAASPVDDDNDDGNVDFEDDDLGHDLSGDIERECILFYQSFY